MTDSDTGGPDPADGVVHATTPNASRPDGQVPSVTERPAYRIRESETVTEAVVRAVCAETGSDPTRLDPLYSVIDPEALNALFSDRDGGGSQRAHASVAFDYCGRQIVISASGTVRVSPLE